MKIHIIGGSGSGKTYLAKRLSKKYKTKHFDLDNIFWDNTANSYGTKNSPEKRDKLLSDILKNDGWIIEGIYYSWLQECFEKADKIILLDLPKKFCKKRILKRFYNRKKYRFTHRRFGAVIKKETLKSVIGLIKWTDVFYEKNLPEIYNILKNYDNKILVFHSEEEVNDFINGEN